MGGVSPHDAAKIAEDGIERGRPEEAMASRDLGYLLTADKVSHGETPLAGVQIEERG